MKKAFEHRGSWIRTQV